MGLNCDGPYPSQPDFVRSPVGEKMHFQFVSSGNDSQKAQVRYEDQDSNSILAARSNPDRAHELGINFGDLIFDVQAQNVRLGIEGSATACD